MAAEPGARRPPRVAAVVPAGGSGRRLGGGVPKQYVVLAGEPLLLRSLRPLLADARVEWVVIALPPGDAAAPPPWLAGLDPRLRFVSGGDERGDSVRQALGAVPEEAEIVVVHDAARPLLSAAVLDRCISAAAEGYGAVAAIPLSDTVKEVDEHGRVTGTPDRRLLWRAQTPQAFPRAMVVDAYRRAAADGLSATDDAGVVEAYGGEVRVVEGSPDNLKVTRPADVVVAEALLARRTRSGRDV